MTTSDPYAPKSRHLPGGRRVPLVDDRAAELPVERMRRLGADDDAVGYLQAVWDSLGDEERSRWIAELSVMTDDELADEVAVLQLDELPPPDQVASELAADLDERPEVHEPAVVVDPQGLDPLSDPPAGVYDPDDLPEGFGLGRVIVPDERDAAFPMSAVVPAASERGYRYWNPSGIWLDQGATPQCVAFAWTHWLEDGPVTRPETEHGGDVPVVNPAEVYAEAQTIDEWPGEDYDGTSVRAGAKVLQQLGYIGEYRWASDLDTVVRALLEVGPVVVGTWWYDSMFTPRDDYLVIDDGAAKVGGHAYLLNGVNVKDRKLRIKNSWGRRWADDGTAWMTFDTFEALLSDWGEACLAVEIPSDA